MPSPSSPVGAIGQPLRLACRLVRGFMILAAPALLAAQAAQAQSVRLTLATIPESIPAVRPDGSFIPGQRPGFRVEVLQAAGRACGAGVGFVPVPWQRALEMVRTGAADGAFSASWSAGRAEFGVFPMRQGAPDAARAMKGYTYKLYVPDGSRLAWDGKAVSGGAGARVIVERGSAGADLARRLGLDPVPVAGYANMVRMLGERRADALIGIDVHVAAQRAGDPRLAAAFREVEPALEARHGYVMFSKRFHAAHADLAECFWNALGDIRSKPAYRALVESYQNGEFVE